MFTVIPVLYIALLVQFPLIGQTAKRLTDRMDKLKTTSDHSESWARSFKTKRMADLAEFGVIITLVAGGLLIGSSIFGEIQSILALYHQSDTPATGRSVLICFIVLLVATLLSPAWTILIAAGRHWYHSEFSEEDRNNFEQARQMSKEVRNIFEQLRQKPSDKTVQAEALKFFEQHGQKPSDKTVQAESKQPSSESETNSTNSPL